MADLHEIVPAHQPDKAQPRKTLVQHLQGIGGVMRPSQSVFEIADNDAPTSGGDPPCSFEPNRERRHAGSRLQWVLRRDQPPYLIKIQPFEAGQAQMQMAGVSRVERAAEQPDAAVPALPAAVQGRTWPLPRTRYL